MTLWLRVLNALQDETLDDTTRGAVLSHAAVQLATRRTPEGQRPTPEDVMAVAFEEFAVLIDINQARAALSETGLPDA